MITLTILLIKTVIKKVIKIVILVANINFNNHQYIT
jgi:hypothetical protein